MYFLSSGVKGLGPGHAVRNLSHYQIGCLPMVIFLCHFVTPLTCIWHITEQCPTAHTNSRASLSSQDHAVRNLSHYQIWCLPIVIYPRHFVSPLTCIWHITERCPTAHLGRVIQLAAFFILVPGFWHFGVDAGMLATGKNCHPVKMASTVIHIKKLKVRGSIALFQRTV